MFNAERTSFEFDPDEQAQAMVRLIFAGFPRRGTPYSLLRYLARQQIKLPVRLRSGPERGQLHWHRPNNPARKESCSSAGATSQTSCSADCWFNGDSICPMTRKRPESVVLSEHEWWLPDLADTLDMPRTGLNLWYDIGWIRGRKLAGHFLRLAGTPGNDSALPALTGR